MLESAKASARRVFLMMLSFLCVLTISLVGLGAIAWALWSWLQAFMSPPLAALLVGIGYLIAAVSFHMLVRSTFRTEPEAGSFIYSSDEVEAADDESESDVASSVLGFVTDPTKLRWLSLLISFSAIAQRHKKGVLAAAAVGGLVLSVSPKARAELINLAEQMRQKYLPDDTGQSNDISKPVAATSLETRSYSDNIRR